MVTTKPLSLAKPRPLPARAAEAFTHAYVHSLRTEAQQARHKAAEADQRAKAAEAACERTRLDADARVIQAVLRTLARAARMIDLDGLKLADLSAVTVDATGEVTGAAEALEALRRGKPFLFEAVSTSSIARVPPPSR